MDLENGVRRARAFARETTGEAWTDDLTLLLLAAAGVAAGVGLALAARRPTTRRRLVRGARAMRRDLDRAARSGLARGRRAAESVPLDDVRDAMAGYVETAREAIHDAAAGELRALRKAMRRRRKQLGL